MDYQITEAMKAEWRIQISDINLKLSRLLIERDMDPGAARNVLAVLDELYNEVRDLYTITDPDLTIITEIVSNIENKNKMGSNDGERRRNSILAVEELKVDDETIVNLYDIKHEMIRRQADVKNLLDKIKHKNDTCITFSGIMKIEANLLKGNPNA